MATHFSCTLCGNCCRDLRLPLSIDEAIRWLTHSGRVELFCEAIPWPEEPPADDRQAHYRRERSFVATSGALPVRVVVTLVASFNGPCPNLQADQRCGAYETRPNVCRIYPAEVNPFVELDPASKSCPPDAWTADQPVFIDGGRLVDAETAALIDVARSNAVRDVAAKQHLCALLGCHTASLANEGFAIHSPDRDRLLAALNAVRDAASTPQPHTVAAPWSFVSNRRATLDTLTSIGAPCVPAGDTAAFAGSYLNFFPAD